MKEMAQVIDEVVDMLKENPVTVFCGAGISVQSGLPLGFGANGLVPHLTSALGFDEEDSKLIADSRVPFESVMEALGRGSDLGPLLDIYTHGVPNDAHRFLGRLVARGIADTLSTTNFDLLLGKALDELDVRYTRLCRESSFEVEDWRNPVPRILKLHGSTDDMESIVVTLSRVAQRRLGSAREGAVRYAFTSLPGSRASRTVVILGYSCSDVFDILPAIKNLEDKSAGIIYIDHTNNPEAFEFKDRIHPSSLPDSAKAATGDENPFVGFKTQISVRVETSKFLQALNNRLFPGEELDFASQPGPDWRASIKQWVRGQSLEEMAERRMILLDDVLLYKVAQEPEKGFEHLNPRFRAAVLHRQGDYNSAAEEYKRALESGLEPLLLANTLSNYGRLMNEVGQPRDAIEQFKRSEVILENHPAPMSLLQAYRGHANAHMILGEFDEAREKGEAALGFSKEIGNPREEAYCHINLANVYYRLKVFDTMMTHLDEANRLGTLMGDDFILGTAAGNRGLYEQGVGQAETMLGSEDKGRQHQQRAIELFEQSLERFVRLGDRASEAKTRFNLANSMTGFPDQLEDSIEEFEHAAQVAGECGLMEVLGGAWQSIGEVLLMHLRRPEDAMKKLEMAIDTLLKTNDQRHLIAAVSQLYIALRALNPEREANRRFDYNLEKYPGIPPVLIQLARTSGAMRYATLKRLGRL